MSVAAQADAIKDVLLNWTQERGGTVQVASNLRDMWSRASQSSQKPIILICFMGEYPRGPFARAAISHRVDRHWAVAVVRGRGFAYVRGDTLTESVGQAEPFYDSVESVRDLLRQAGGRLSAENIVDYKGVKPMQLGNLIIDGYLIDFTTAIDLSSLN